MRRGTGRQRFRWAGITVLTLVATTGLAGTAGWGAPGTRAVEYAGLALRVPESWPVIDLAEQPDTCARVDRHAIYLGTPGERASCPPRVTGRTETISLRPLTGTVPPGTTVVPHGTPEAAPASTDHGGRWALEAAGVLLSTTYGTDPAQLSAILATARITAGATPRRAVRPEAAEAATTMVPGTHRGWGFDACQAPTSATMDKWRSGSDYRAVGVYIGGGDLGCPDQPNLGPSWVSRQTGRGWHVFPIYVGRQAPCSNEPFKITASKAASQGTADAADAAAKAGQYGMAHGSIVVNDMEWYPRGGSCSTAVLTYLSAWTKGLHAHDYRSGVYSSRAAAIDDLVAARPSGRYTMPGTIDFAQWDHKATVSDPDIPATYWASHHRMKQYSGAHDEKYGGVTINIDSSWIDVA
ncbi:DUF1906 domain-containing protein [Actinocatenispora rupis]|uniref:Rv2525c-like glycoside hydrolase-like domain-containing protein n=1 Tax=Actinocatenispora rupis TaxID=519421 RepID=A0A8J3JGD0_9ACTN|nr:DUF1906 domain-containing protein [Actinocatenispora rupis]GID15882.1 hypothetical protein Aru02nite_67710 [Actinocatenispora rupis]